jgi:hypothetical protein
MLDFNVWRGTHIGFIVHFLDKLREYDNLMPTAERLSEGSKLTLIQQAVSNIPGLDMIKMNVELEVAQGRPKMTYTAYLSLLRSTASTLDQRDMRMSLKKSSSSPSSTPANVVAANMHRQDFLEIYGCMEEDYECNVHDFHGVNDESTSHGIDTGIDQLDVYRAHTRPGRGFRGTNRISLDQST